MLAPLSPNANCCVYLLRCKDEPYRTIQSRLDFKGSRAASVCKTLASECLDKIIAHCPPQRDSGTPSPRGQRATDARVAMRPRGGSDAPASCSAPRPATVRSQEAGGASRRAHPSTTTKRAPTKAIEMKRMTGTPRNVELWTTRCGTSRAIQ